MSSAVPNYSSTSTSSPSNGVSTITRTKILLLGLRRAGKTSIQQVLFNNLPPNQTFYLETTMRIQKHHVDSVIPLEIWDCPANTTVESLGVPLSQFSTIIFVIDIRDLYNQPISKLVEFIVASYAENPDIILEVFVHKAEKLQEDDKIENFRQIHERVSDRLLDMSPEYEQMQLNFHLTSVYDHSLHEAFSRVLHKLIESLPFLEELLNVFCANSQSPKAFLFDTRSRLYVATDASPVDSATHNLCCDYLQMLNSFGPLYNHPRSVTATPARKSQLMGEPLFGSIPVPSTPPPSSSSSSLSPHTSSSSSTFASHSPPRSNPRSTSSSQRPAPPPISGSSTLLSPIPLTPPTPTTPRAPASSLQASGVINPTDLSRSTASTHTLTPTPSPLQGSTLNGSYFPPISADTSGQAQTQSTLLEAQVQTQTSRIHQHKTFFYPSASTTLSSPSSNTSLSSSSAYSSHSRPAQTLASSSSTPNTRSPSYKPCNGTSSGPNDSNSNTNGNKPTNVNTNGTSASAGTTTLTYHLVTRHLALLALIPTSVYVERRGLVEYNVVFFREGVQEICDVEEEARA